MTVTIKFKPAYLIILLLVALAIAVFFVFRDYSIKKQRFSELIPKPAAEKVQVPKPPDLYFVSEKNTWVLYYTRGGGIEAAWAPDMPSPINSILPSPDRQAVAFILQEGKINENNLGPFFEGRLNLEIVNTTASRSDQGYLLLDQGKVSTLAYFWHDQEIFIRAATLNGQGNRQMQHWRAAATEHSLKSISAQEYDSLVKSEKLEIIFSDFVSGAFRKSNQTLKGERLTLDRDQISLIKGDQVKPLVKASQFFDPPDSLFNAFQISPDEKHLAFTKDVDQCNWISAKLDLKLMNQLFIYDLESGKQVMVAAHNSPMNFLWIDNENLAFDLGFGEKTNIYLYSLKDNKVEGISGEIKYYGPQKGPNAFFFINNSPRCET